MCEQLQKKVNDKHKAVREEVMKLMARMIDIAGERGENMLKKVEKYVSGITKAIVDNVHDCNADVRYATHELFAVLQQWFPKYAKHLPGAVLQSLQGMKGTGSSRNNNNKNKMMMMASESQQEYDATGFSSAYQ